MIFKPQFPVGYEVVVGYMGLYRADETPGRGVHPLPGTIQGMRLEPRIEEDDEGELVVSYPKGWEYLIGVLVPAGPDRSGQWKEYGWFSEQELIDHEYVVPDQTCLAE